MGIGGDGYRRLCRLCHLAGMMSRIMQLFAQWTSLFAFPLVGCFDHTFLNIPTVTWTALDMADQRQNEPAYSTLEVTSSVSEPRQQLSAAQPVCMPESSHRLLGQHDLRHTVDNVLPEAVHDSWPVPAQKEYYDQNQAPGHVPPQDPTPAAAQNRFCGLSRKALWMVIILVLLSIGGIVGGVAGGLTSREPRNEPGNSTATEPTSGSATGVLSSSQLATINWTDSASVQRRAVFYQRSGALFYSQYHASNKSWTQFNISAVFEREPPEDALRVKFGTPLATGAVSLEDIEYATTEGHSTVFAACLYFMDDDNHLREVYSNDYDLTSWVQGSLKDASLEAAGDSHLSALADYCPNPQCTSQFILTYQGTDGEIMMASGPSWTSPRQVDMGNTASALAIIPMASNGGRNITDISEMRIFYYSNTAFEFYYWNFKGLVSGK